MQCVTLGGITPGLTVNTFDTRPSQPTVTSTTIEYAPDPVPGGKQRGVERATPAIPAVIWLVVRPVPPVTPFSSIVLADGARQCFGAGRVRCGGVTATFGIWGFVSCILRCSISRDSASP